MAKRPLPAPWPNGKPAAVDDLDAAILALLGRLPLRWEPIDVDGLTEEEFAYILRTFPLVARDVKGVALAAYRGVTRGAIR